MINQTKYTHRVLYRIVLEAETPLAIGTGEKTFLSDSAVALDINGLPYIPATSIAGVIRHALSKDEAENILGFQNGEKGRGSNVIFTEARIVDSKGTVRDGVFDVTEDGDSLLKEYFQLPIRQHVRINEKGTAKDGGKFDNEVVFAGTRFCFEMEFLFEKDKDCAVCDKFIEIISDSQFRIGSGTRNGLGKLGIVKIQKCELDLTVNEKLNLYIKKSSNLTCSATWEGWSEVKKVDNTTKAPIVYKLTLTPNDFFLFGSGYGDNDSDMNAVTESKVVWNDDKGSIVKQQTLIPATSVKGALSHRVAFHYNKEKHIYAGSDAAKASLENGNEAVKKLFGYENQEKKKQVRGKLLFSDIIEKELEGHILNHVAIDRFTGGAIDGALFAERPLYGKDEEYNMEIILTETVDDEKIINALDNAIKDICTGMLPLGGGVNRGNGIFKGTAIKVTEGKEETLC